MANGIYALANPNGEGATLSQTEQTHGIAKYWNMVCSAKDAFCDFMDDAPMAKVYEEHKKEVAIGWGIAAAVVVGALAVAACVVTGGLAAGLVVVAGAAMVGTISAATNVASQAVGCLAKGEKVEIDPYQVMISGFSGAISGAVAFSPLGVGGQVVVNGILGGATSITTGGTVAESLLSTAAGALAGYIGGDGVDWRDTTIFVKQGMREGIAECSFRKLIVRFEESFKRALNGVDPRLYPYEAWGGVWNGFWKGTAASNTISNLFTVLSALTNRKKKEEEKKEDLLYNKVYEQNKIQYE